VRTIKVLSVGLTTAMWAAAAFSTRALEMHSVSNPIDSRYRFNERLTQEIWRQGRPSAQFVADLVREALATRNKEYVDLAGRRAIEMLRPYQLDPTPFAELVESLREFEGETGSLAEGFRQQIIWSNLGLRGRRAIYLQVLASDEGKTVQIGPSEYYLYWPLAAQWALEEELDDLVPMIEGALPRVKQKITPSGRGNDCEWIERVYLPLARARRSKDAAGQYADLLKAAAGERWKNDAMRETLFRLALLDLVRRNERPVVDELKRIWKIEHQQARELYERSNSNSPHQEFDGVELKGIPLYLVAGVRALGEPNLAAERVRASPVGHGSAGARLVAPLHEQCLDVPPPSLGMLLRQRGMITAATECGGGDQPPRPHRRREEACFSEYPAQSGTPCQLRRRWSGTTWPTRAQA